MAVHNGYSVNRFVFFGQDALSPSSLSYPPGETCTNYNSITIAPFVTANQADSYIHGNDIILPYTTMNILSLQMNLLYGSITEKK